jgi:hypothetical protein
MKYHKSSGEFSIAFCCWAGALALLTAPLAGAAEPGGTLRTDSQAPYVHRISLYDAEGTIIAPKSESAPPYSPAATCGKCHNCGVIKTGWHFNASDPDAPAGRPGEPWILTDLATGTQLPVSERGWPGTYRPTDVGLTPWQFVQTFGGYTPGGGLGEKYPEKPEDPNARWKVSGRLEVDCQSCHSADPARDQTEWGKQIENQNLKWAPVAAEGLAILRGSAKQGGGAGGDILAEADPAAAEHASANVKVIYDAKRFDADDRVFLNIPRKPTSDRCLFCHSSRPAGEEGLEFKTDGDVHLSKGLACADCHRNGLDHAMARGDEGEGMRASTLSCRGCHESGRLGAPRPIHSGLPVSHLKRLTCTACHSGLLPGDQARSTRTARAHRLGTASMHRREDVPPFIVGTVFVREADRRIAPHRMMWPAFWGRMAGEKVTPLAPSAVREIIGATQIKAEEWKPLTEDQIAKGLKAFAAKKDDAGEAVYISAGRLYRLGSDGKLSGSEHAAAAPYSWPIAHDVRPAAQSLGSRGCTDCHSAKAGFFYSTVASVGPMKIGAPVSKAMYEFEGQKPRDLEAWNASVRHRKFWAITNLVAAAIVGCVLLIFSVSALSSLLRGIFVRQPRRKE